MDIALKIYLTLILPNLIAGQCTWPSQLISSTWTDSGQGELVFGETTMTGWSFERTDQVIDEWQCTNVDQFDTEGYLVMRSVSDFTQFVTSQYYAYLCLKMTEVTDYSYRYYIFEPQQPELGWDRYLIHTVDSLSTVETVCYEAYGASGAEYRVMIKAGSESSAGINCPWAFLGSFDYSHTSVSGTTTCSAAGDTWSTCADITQMVFDYSTCPVDAAYSDYNTVTCVDTVPVGDENYVTVYNGGGYDGVNTFQFACFAIKDDLTTVSVAPGYCRHGQTSAEYPVDTSQQNHLRNDIGALIEITAVHERCLTCPELDAPDGGAVQIETNGAATTATYTCDAGYALYGEAVRTCQENNTWTSEPPTCKCEEPNPPDNGNVAVSYDGTLATYSCDLGYVLKGNQYRGCQTDGNAWNGTEPTCETCSVLDTLENGFINYTSQGYSTVAVFGCNVGYSLAGAGNITCLDDGTWSNTTPDCVECATLTTPSLGAVSLNTDGINTLATFSCDTGYKVLGDGVITCSSSGSWDKAEPSCICDNPEEAVNGDVTVSADGLTATYTCDVAFTMDGNYKRACLLNGSSWTGNVPICTTCDSVQSPSGGNFTMATNGTHTTGSVSCLPGYTVQGEVTIECSRDGTWSQNDVSCVECDILESPSSGNVTITTNGSVSVAEYTCTDGYILTGSSIRQCGSDGVWNGEPGTCGCEDTGAPLNGNVTVIGDTRYYICAVNYTLSGAVESVCYTNGSGLSNPKPECVACEDVQVISGGSVTLSSDRGLFTEATFFCDVGYTRVGSNMTTCSTDGSWDTTSPYCQICDPVTSPDNGSVVLTTDGSQTVVQYSCDVGFTVDDVTTVYSECDQHGGWTVQPASCVTCETLRNISSGSVTLVTNDTVTTAVYVCMAGYQLVGDDTRTCGNDGSWSLAEPQCQCEDPAEINNGEFVVSEDGMSAIYTCDTGYSMDGNSYIVCQDGGLGWNGTSPICVTCETLFDPSDGAVSITTDGSSSIASYTCDVGYSLDGRALQTCLSDGTWTDQSPTCVLCDTISDPDSGSMVQHFDLASTLATFDCVVGYFIVGNSVLSCNSYGTWNDTAPTCVCDLPLAPVNGSISISNGGMTVTYQCDVGYTLNGDITRTCQTQAMSWTGSSPSCVVCESLEDLQSGQINYSSNGSVTEVTFSCDVGYTMVMTSNATLVTSTAECSQTGQWNAPNITCVQCEAIEAPNSGSIQLFTDGITTEALFECTTDYVMTGSNVSECGTSGDWDNSSPSCACIQPATPLEYGSVDVSMDNMTLTYSCEPGYTLTGSSTRNCSTKGNGWSGDQPTCGTCDSLTTPTNGNYTLSSDGTVTLAMFHCYVGSTMSGVDTLTCAIDGSWDGIEPECRQCPDLVSPTSGFVSLSTNGILTTAEFTCVADYHAIGDDVITCYEDGSWSDSEPTCVCDTPSTPTDGTISLSSDGMTVYYQCDVGFTISGNSSRQCSTSGTGWQGADPTCVSCPTISNPVGGTLDLTTNGTQTVAYFTCDLGYTMDGLASIACDSGAVWSDDTPSCVQCPSVDEPDSGSITMTTNGEQTMVTYSCVEGYQLTGQVDSLCQSDGVWSVDGQTCVCIPPATPDNGYISTSDNGTIVTYTCMTGYSLKGVDTRVCQSSGAGWNENQPSCVTCDPLTNPTGATINTTTSGTVTVAHVTCDTGYTIDGSSTLTCRTDGSWDISIPTCNVCNSLTVSTGGSVDMYSDNSVTKANFTCNVGYSLSGVSLLTCRTDGNWDFNEPVCVKCDDLTDVNSGNITMTTNGVTSEGFVTCVDGYHVFGQGLLSCSADGTWDNEVPACVCDVPLVPSNGSYVLTDNGMTTTYSCDVGYTLVGESVVTCLDNGAGWTVPSPVCVGCPSLPTIANGAAEMTTDGVTTTWSVYCDVGTTISVAGYLTCTDSGTWSLEQPSCVTCPTLSVPDNGDVNILADGESSSATFSCDVGYSLDGNNTVQCGNDGTWSDSSPQCVQCVALSMLLSGDIDYSTNGTNTVASFTCNQAYYVDGSTDVTCEGNGLWDTDIPSCVCESPSSPANGSIWISDDGMSAKYYCELGFTLNGQSNNTCLHDGTGWMSNNPTCVQCQTTFDPLNGELAIYTDGETTYSILSCTSGYSLSIADNVLTCDADGIWSSDSVECVQCDDLYAPDSGFVTVSTNGSRSIATYTCMTGYYLLGTNEGHCLTNGSWDHVLSSCVCDSPTNFANGQMNVSSDLLGVSYSCDSGFSLNGISDRHCASDGTGWSGEEPVCVTCNTLNSVTGGSVQLYTDGLSTYANFTCASGFSMNGESWVECRSDGTWNWNPPICELCTTLVTGIGGSYTTYTDGITSQVTFECDAGYTMVGTAMATCSSTGLWSSSEPECVWCEQLGNLDSSTIQMSTNGSITSAFFTCVAGYHLVGDNSSFCQSDGSWNTSLPYCVCDHPSTSGNGSITLFGNGFNVLYECDPGFTMEGDAYLECDDGGSGWNGTVPECTQCEALVTPNNGTVLLSSDGQETVVSVSCEQGFSSSGTSTLTCLPDGSYDFCMPDCVECQEISQPSDGSLTLFTNGTQTSATVACDLGYSLKGDQEIQCLQDGSWSNKPATCEPCEPFPAISSGSSSMATNGSVTYSTITCAEGYILSGSDTVYCSDTGDWSDIPTCECESPDVPENGKVNSSGLIATFTCDTGFSLDGSITSVCGTDGEGWLTNPPICVECEQIADMNIGESTVLSDATSQTYIQYTCPVGYTLDGQDINYCHTNGSWLEHVPACVECESLSDPQSGTVSLQTDNLTTTAMYSCVDGYVIDGTDAMVCNTDGTWTLDEPTCVCSYPGTPENGNVTVSSDHVRATYTCDTGYTINGQTTRTCGQDGSGWSSTQPSCAICDTLATPSGGTVAIATDGTITTATFTCTEGFTLDGVTSITCRSDGSWNTSSPSCVSCESLQTPTNGGYSIYTNGETSVATFTCDVGYSLQGASTLTCNVAGQFDQNEPTCSVCTALVTPDSGTMITNTNGTVTTASFSCLPDYYMVGDPELTCLDDGTWDNTEPDCYCDAPPPISNGSFNISTDNMSVAYTCLEGYTLDGSTNRLCQTDGQGWDGSTPSCVICDTLPTLDNGTISVATNGSVTTASVTCVVGSVLVGEPYIECTSAGSWTEPNITCVSCDNLDTPTNGFISQRTNGTTTIADISCNQGYTLPGSPKLTCREDGTWSSSVPVCVLCLTLDNIDNGDVIVSSDGQVTSTSYSCHPGYDLVGADRLSCRVDGTWNDSIPACVCSTPLPIIDGNYTIYTGGMVVEYACDVGYSMLREPVRYCTTNSTGWTGTPPSCTKCDELTAPLDGSITTTSDGVTSTAVYSCDIGYSLNGTYTGTCDQNGNWDLSMPTCVQCPSLDEINNGAIDESTNGSITMVTYTCDTEYYLDVSGYRYCLDGAWLGTEPTCLCSSSSFFPDGEVQSNGSVIIYSCDTGYSLNGTNTRICQQDGSGWSLNEPSCEKCETLSVPSGGAVNVSSNGDTTIASFSCSLGYTMSGSPTLTCASDGTWDLSPPSCGSPCSALASPDNGEVTLSSDGYTTVATFTCSASFSLKGSSLLTCRHDGSWNFVEPSCEQCNALSTPTNGYMNVTTDGSSSMATFSCHGSYYLDGEPMLYCASSGQWNGSEPRCVCIPPNDIGNGYTNISDTGMQIIYSCISGYTLYGDSAITCQDNFLGWTANDTACVTCGETPALENGTVALITDGIITSIQFTCDTGHSILGQTTIECGSYGTWVAEIPECAMCPELSNTSNGSMYLQSDGYVTTAYYSCDIGYTMFGSANVTCLSNATWSELPPSCVACDILQDLSSGNSNQFTDGYSTYTGYTCLSGYHLVGDAVLQCLSDGTWDNSIPTCVCDAPTTPNNGSITLSAGDNVVQYSCQTGYSLDGNVFRGCSQDGSGWNGTDPSCVTCADVATLSNGASTLATDGTLSMLQFACDAGYSLKGETRLTCDSSGVWSDELPDCVLCEDIVSPYSGSVVVSTNGTVTTASYTCDSQYYIVGAETTFCSEDGSWSPTSPHCACNSPSELVDGRMVSDGYTVIYSCDSGYTLYGEYIRLCQNDSSGWNGTQPTCVTCEALPSPAGGNVTIETNGIATSATFYCDTGYTMSGTSTLQCRSDGTWDYSAPTCAPCDTLSVPNNGDVIQLSSGSITLANYSCDIGYTLFGAPLLTCRSSGSWDFTEPYCVVCDDLETTESGSSNMVTNGVSTYVNYACAVDYYLIGDTQRQCDSDGNWSGAKPLCKCVPPDVPYNGTLTMMNDDDTAVFTCDLGFTISGSSMLVCNIDGSGWNGTTPTCVTCGAFEIPPNASLAYSTDGSISSVTLTCEVGTSLTGTPDIECGPSGTWEVIDEPECVTCASISSPVNGTIHLDTNGTITQASFMCSVGTSMVGPSELYCENGTWSGSVPTCEMCPDIETPSGSYISLEHSTDGYMTTMTVTCTSGYNVIGNATIECHGGSWNDDVPACVCDPLPAPSHGDAQLSHGQMDITFDCDVGYTLNGSATSVCSTDGTGWNNNIPDCIACDAVEEIENGSISISTNGTISHVQYTCDVGYTLDGVSERYCSNGGLWTDIDPTCAYCHNLTEPSSGSIVITTEGTTTKAVYSCMSGYALNGTSPRTCSSDGLWTFKDPTCYCELATAPLHGKVAYGETIDESVYTCEQGYTLKGYEKSYCQSAGSGWNTSVPECVLCETLVLSAGVMHTVSTDGWISEATFECDVGYTMQGEGTLTCRDNGSWDLQEPICVSCDTIAPPIGGNVTFTTSNSVTQAMVNCDVGYTLVGSQSLTCRSDGSWDFTTPSCVVCPDITTFDSGRFNISTDGSQTRVTFECDSVYYLDGLASLTCEVDGNWSDQTPSCKCLQPQAIDNGILNMSGDGMTAVYVCDAGFAMNSTDTLVCQSNGLGWDGDAPGCVQCENLSNLSNGTIGIETNGTLSKASFMCDNGFTMSGFTEITCLGDGTWTSEIPTCVQCQDVVTPTNGSSYWVTDGVTSSVMFECDTGYSLTGTASVSCMTSGTFDEDPPSCIQCAELTQPTNGDVTIESNGTTTYAVYGCDTDYTIVGNDVIECLSGIWNAPSSYCECSYFMKPSDGNIELSNNGSAAIYTCDVGFSLNGESEQICGTTSLLSSQTAPTCQACETLNNTGVSVNLSTDGSSTIASFECAAGYAMVGQATSECRSDGTWSASTPLCTSCDTLYVPDGGSIEISSDRITTSASLVCSSGYTLNGIRTASCKNDGKWDFSIGACVKCQEISTPPGGSVTYSSNGTVTMAAFSCDNGYYTTDEKSALCEIDGSWSAASPTCVCESPSTVANATLSLSDAGFTVLYSCDVGYSLQGATIRYCDVDGGGWSDEDPVCNGCPELSNLVNGSNLVESDGILTIVSVRCEQGYSVSGSNVLECLSNGSWISEQPTCEQCDTFDDIVNGSVLLSTNGSQSILSYTCDAGFTLVGSVSRYCMSNGTWESYTPMCVYCPQLNYLENGEVVVQSNGTVSIARFECNENYILIGSDIAVCSDDQGWDEIIPTCVCSSFGTLENGEISITDNGTKAVYTCDASFTMLGNDKQVCGQLTATGETPTVPICNQCENLAISSDLTVQQVTDGTTTTAVFQCPSGSSMNGLANVTCRPDGTWDFAIPSCEPCTALTVSIGANVSIASDGQTTTATFACDTGFTLSGQNVLVCNANGLWNYEEPSCAQCSSLSDPDSGVVNVSTDGETTTGTFECTVGYYIDGVSILTCQETGEWDNYAPLCICDPPEDIDHGEFTITDNGMTVVYTCALNYTLNGNETRYCDSTGEGFLGESPTCFGCMSLTDQLNGTVHFTTNGITSQAVFTCEEGYTLSGPAVIECQPNGLWNIETQPTCESCSSLNDVDNGTYIVSTNATSTFVDYSCAIGFTLSGPASRLCLDDGSWTDDPPVCVLCDAVPDVENGIITIITNGSLSVASFQCNKHYVLTHADDIYCTESGTWSLSPPFCVCSTFGQPDDGNIVISDNGTTAVYSCEAGTTLSGESEQMCGVQTYTGDDFTVPTCVSCDTLSSSTVASFELSSDGTSTVASYQCPAGYTMIGSSNLTCRSDRTWDVSPPECTACDALTVSVGANVSTVSDGQTTIATFTCDIGFTLSGTNILTCNDNGLWNYVEPTCVQCPSLSNPDSGAVNVSTDGGITIVTFECNQGYYMDGAAMITCKETGEWDNNAPLCICDPPEDIDNGGYTISDSGMMVVYTCALNYTLDGNNTRYCNSMGAGFIGESPTCFRCLPLLDHLNGTIQLTTDGVNTKAIFTCEQGYTLSGISMVECQPNGLWNFESQPTCEQCSILNVVDNGSYVVSTNATSTFVDYSCENGFTLSGPVRRLCLDDGSWADDPPVCVLCDSLTDVENGIITMTTNGSLSVASFQCNEHYVLTHADDIYCTESGTWSLSPPSCVCSTFGQPDGGNIVISDNGTSAVYSCEAGKTLSGESEQICGVQTSTGDDFNVPECVTCNTLESSTVAMFELSSDGKSTVASYQCPVGYTIIGSSNLTCRTDGTWDISPPSCVSCPTLLVFADGSINIVSDGEQTQALFACDSGSTLSGENTLTCTAGGSWNYEQPVCVICPALSFPDSGYINISTDGSVSIATYTCAEDYYLAGENVLTCTEAGLWDYELPTCKCIVPADLPNGTYTVSSDGENVTYACNIGYSLRGDSVRHCGADGTGWSGHQPECVKCSTLPTVTAQSFNLTSDGKTTFAHYYCDVGTSIDGEEIISCLSNGSWSDDNPSCVSCPNLLVDETVTMTLESDGSKTTATFECDVGYTLVGDVHTECLSSGTWSISVPSCIECPNLSHPKNGAVDTAYTGSQTVATFSCDAGYSLIGYAVINCLQTGNWSETAPACECDSFTIPLDGTMAISDDGTTAIYACDIGYSMNGVSTHACTTSVDATSQPSCVSCDAVSTSQGMTINRTTDGQNTVVVLTCETGYTLVGDNILTCRSDGSWDNNVPMCVSCDTLEPPIGSSIVLQSDGITTTASIACVVGFTLVGESLLSCKGDGSWDFSIPICECNRPDTPDHGYISVSEDTRTVNYYCASGFTLSGPNERYCAADGTWWSGADPICVQCTSLASSAGMNISFIHNDNVAQAVFGCDVGYSLSSNDNVTCLKDGSWSTTIPTCIICASLNSTQGLSFELITDWTSTQAVFSCANNYDLTGAQIATCLQNGLWSVPQPQCVPSSTPSGQNTCEAADTSAAIAFGVLFGLAVIVIIVLAVLLWRFWRRNKRLDGMKSVHVAYKDPYDLKSNPLFTDIDRSSFIPSRAPLDYTRHVTDMGRADSSLAPSSHGKHVMGGGAFREASTISAPLSTRNIRLHSTPPVRPPTIGGRRSPVISITPSSLRESSLDDYLPDQLVTLREDTSVSSAVLGIPKLIYSDKQSKKSNKEKGKSPQPEQRRKSSETSLFFPVEEERYREGSPLPQQILTPRNADDEILDSKSKRGRGRKPKVDLIDQDKNFLKIYEQKGKRSASSGPKSTKFGNISVANIDNPDTDV